jgi:malate dehydrogenase
VTPGVGVDLSHIETNSTVTGFGGPDSLDAALTDCELVIIPAGTHAPVARSAESWSLNDRCADDYGFVFCVLCVGVPRKPGMTRDDLFGINAGIVKTLAEGVARNCPNGTCSSQCLPRRCGIITPMRVLRLPTASVPPPDRLCIYRTP